MPNSYFRFKQFTVHQDQCAMKVCTDACILGAWFAAKLPRYSTILDVGSGTGLLMLMLAQQCDAEIHGIEVDLASFRQSKDNIAQSRWKDRLKVIPGDVRSFTFPSKYDFIIANPPFFEKDLLPEDDANQVARHSKLLTLEELAASIDNNLQGYGACGVLLPYHRWENFRAIAIAQRLHPVEALFVRERAGGQPFRAILHFSRNKENFVPHYTLTIHDEANQYTPEFVEIMKGYYLNL